VVAETSIGVAGRVRFETGNWFATYSNNGGGTWAFVDPFTEFSTAGTGGFCCDQEVIYDPSRDMMFWLLQYIHTGTTSSSNNRIRLAFFRNTSNNIGPAGWFFYDFFPSQAGGPASGEEFDYPHMALSNNFLYIAVNVFSTSTGLFTRTVMLRLPLDTILAGGALSFNFFSTTANFTFAPIQGAKDVMYRASHNATSSMRIFRWPETTTTVSIFDRAVTTWSSAAPHSCPSSDGTNWCLFSDNRILTGVRTVNQLTRQSELWFFWNVAQNGSFTKPYVDAVRFRESDLVNVGRPLLFSSTVTFHYVGAAANTRGDIGLSLFQSAGAGQFPSSIMCIADDFTAVPAPWSCFFATVGTNGPNANRWGDFVSVRPASPPGLGWATASWTQQGGTDGAHTVPQHLVFGRSRDLNSYNRWSLK
jgi:hypothetical protein